MAPTKIPIEAQQEIYDLLSARLRISADELVAVLRKYGVAGEVDMLQDRYRRRLGQSLMASLRDEKGRREVFAVVDDRGETVTKRGAVRCLQSSTTVVKQSIFPSITATTALS